jgi:hypothetical protein
MPNIFHNIPVAPAALASQKDLDAAVVAATPKQVMFAGLIVNIPFGKRGSTQTRSTAKGYGAKWDGKEWTLPASKYQPGLEALEWFRTNGLIIGIKTRQYVAWVWDGANTTDLALDIPFDERHTAKSLGAKWEPQFSRWYLPAGQITQTRVDALNAAEAIAGYMNKQGQIAPQLANLAAAPAPVTAPAAPARRPVQGVQRPCSSANFVSLVAMRWNDLATNLALTYGDSADPERLLRGAELDAAFASKPKHWLSAHDANGGAFVCFTEVPSAHMARESCIVMTVIPAVASGAIERGRHAGGSINAYLNEPLSLLDAVELQGVSSRADAIALYEDLANNHGFKPYRPA